MNTENTTNTNTKNNKIKIIIIIIAAVIALAAVGFIFYKAINRFIRDDNNNIEDAGPKEANVTLFKCHIFKNLNDSEISEIKNVVENAVGNKVLKISKANTPVVMSDTIVDEDGESIDAGEAAEIIFSVLSETEKSDMMAALVNKYDLLDKIPDNNLNYIIEIKDMHKAEFDEKK